MKQDWSTGSSLEWPIEKVALWGRLLYSKLKFNLRYCWLQGYSPSVNITPQLIQRLRKCLNFPVCRLSKRERDRGAAIFVDNLFSKSYPWMSTWLSMLVSRSINVISASGDFTICQAIKDIYSITLIWDHSLVRLVVMIAAVGNSVPLLHILEVCMVLRFFC